MAVQAQITLFKKEFVLAYEQRKTLLAGATQKEIMSNGLVNTWLISGAGRSGMVSFTVIILEVSAGAITPYS